MKPVRHIYSPLAGNEFSFCGLAFDSYGTGDSQADDEFEEGRPGLRVTCPDCVQAIRLMRAVTKNVVLAPRRGDFDADWTNPS